MSSTQAHGGRTATSLPSSTNLHSPERSRHLAAQACPYANICEQCDNTTTAEFLPALQDQLADEHALRDDAEARGWDGEVARHARVITSLQHHLDRFKQPEETGTKD